MSRIHSTRRSSDPGTRRRHSKSSSTPPSWPSPSTRKHADTESDSSSIKTSNSLPAQFVDLERVVVEVANAVANAAKEAALQQVRASLEAHLQASTSGLKVQKAGSMPAAFGEELWSRSWTLTSGRSPVVENLFDLEENLNSSLLWNFLKAGELQMCSTGSNSMEVGDNAGSAEVPGRELKLPCSVDSDLTLQHMDTMHSILSGQVSQIGPASNASSAHGRIAPGPTLLTSLQIPTDENGYTSDRSMSMKSSQIPSISSKSSQISSSKASRRGAGKTSRGLGLFGSFRGVFTHSQTAMNIICSANDADLSRQALGNVNASSFDLVWSVEPWRRFSSVSFWMRIWGIHPCSVLGVWWNQLGSLGVVAIVATYRLIVLFFTELQLHHLCDVILTLGAVGCLTSARMLHKCDLFDSRELGLLKYASHCGFEGAWHSNANKYLLQAVLTWISAVCSRAVLKLAHPLGDDASSGPLGQLQFPSAMVQCIDIATFAFPAGIFVAMTFCVLHYTNALVLAVDAFSDKLKGGADHSSLSQEWNILRALLRRASRAMENGFLVLVTTAILMLTLCAMDLLLSSRKTEYGPLGEILPVFVPICILSAWVFRMFFRAADVTGTCRRMPPLVNALSFSGNQGRFYPYDKHLLVEYIRNSAAGFYIREVTVTAEVALKIVSVGGMAIFTVLTKAVTQN